MANSIWSREIVQRSGFEHLFCQLGNFGPPAIGEKHRLCVRLQREHMPCAIVFLILPRLFVLADNVFLVLIDVNTPDEPGLSAPVHYLAIKKERRRTIADENASGHKGIERLACLPVYPGVVRIDLLGQVYVRAPNMQKTVRISLRKGSRPPLGSPRRMERRQPGLPAWAWDAAR